MRIISIVASAAIVAGGTLLAAQPAQAACQATQTASATPDWSDNCTTSTSANATSDLTTAIQQWLSAYLLDPGAIDGVFGSKTKSAVIQAQKDFWPKDSSQWDGVVGPKTWAKMDNHISLATRTSSYYEFTNGELGGWRLYRTGSRADKWYTLHSSCTDTLWVAMDSSRSCD